MEKKKYGKWIFYEGRWLPVFAGGSSDDEPSPETPQPPEQPQSPTPQPTDEFKQKYEQTLNFLQEKFGVSSIEELNLKLQKQEEEKLKEQQKFKELAEKKEKEALEFKQKYQQTVLKAEITAKASQMEFIDPQIVLSLVKEKAVVKEDGSVEIDGKPVDEYLKQLAEEKPYLLKATGKTGSGTTPSTNQTQDVEIKSFEDLLKAGSKVMKEFMEKYPEKYQKLKDEYFAKKVGG